MSKQIHPCPWGSAAWKKLVARDLAELRRHLTGGKACTRWVFPWGLVEASDMATVAPQIEDIFLNDGYRFDGNGGLPPRRILDGGGNVGMSALWFRMAYPDAAITVYEPDPRLVEVMTRNLANAKAGGVTIEAKALWTRDGTIAFDGVGDDRGHICENGMTKVIAADILTAIGDGVDLLKLDIEGAEFDCLEHLLASPVIGGVQHIAAELHLNRENTGNAMRVLAGLEQAGFAMAFNARIANWLGDEAECSPFTVVGKGKTFAQLYAWRPGAC